MVDWAMFGQRAGAAVGGGPQSVTGTLEPGHVRLTCHPGAGAGARQHVRSLVPGPRLCRARRGAARFAKNNCECRALRRRASINSRELFVRSNRAAPNARAFAQADARSRAHCARVRVKGHHGGGGVLRETTGTRSRATIIIGSRRMPWAAFQKIVKGPAVQKAGSVAWTASTFRGLLVRSHALP